MAESPTVVTAPSDHHHHHNRKALYVGDLHPDTSETDLLLPFSAIGDLCSIRVCRERLTKKSLCYAYINYNKPSDAAEALSKLNHKEVKGKPMRIMWCQRDPFARKTGVANLFVKNLDSSVTDAKLEEVFGKFGRILSCKTAKDVQGKSKGFGFVQFDLEESATNALGALDGTALDEKIISVAKYLKKSERKEPKFTNVYVKNLDLDFTEDLLREKFSEYGNVTSAVIMNDTDGKSKGFGFVNFESPDSAKKAIEALNGAIIGSNEWFVGKAMKKAEREGLLKLSHLKDKRNASNLFVRNLALSVDEQSLEKTFSAFGNVVLTKVIRHKDGLSKGFGFVCFSNPEEAKKARDSLNGNFYHGMCMNISIAMTKEECAQKLQASFAPQVNGYYGVQSSFARAPVYDQYRQPNVFGRMQVFPSFKPQIHQEVGSSSFDKERKPLTSFNAFFSKGSFAKDTYQNPNGEKSSRVLSEIKAPELKGSGKAFFKGKAKTGIHGKAPESEWFGLKENMSY